MIGHPVVGIDIVNLMSVASFICLLSRLFGVLADP